jgi:protocatechuate 3,4-dioxygenase beta subunit
MPRRLSRTLNDGAFDVTLGEGTWTPECTDPHRMIVARIETRDFKGWTLLVAPSARLAGRVLDEAGLPVPDAQFSYSFHLARLDAFSDLRDQSWQWRVLGTCSHDGAFSFDRVPARSDIRVELQKSGYAQSRLEPRGADDLACEIVLARFALEVRPHLSGMVIDERGNPVAKATVSLGQDQGWTDEQGRFDVPIGTYHPDEPLTAVRQGYQATVLPDFGEARMQSRSEILLRLGPPALSIEGDVRLPDGSNPGRCRVQVIDGTPFGTTQCTLEDVAAGNYQCGIDTDERGHFVLAGLCARDYRLLAYDPLHGQIAYTEPIAAGSKGVAVQDKPEDFLPTVRGRVVTRHGLPLENVEVGRSMCFYKTTNSWSSKVTGKVSTDAQGRFELRNVPRKWSRIELGGPSIRAGTRDLPARQAADLEFVAELEVRTRLEITDSTIDEVRFLDELGERVHPIIETPEGTSQQFSLPRSDGKFPTFAIYDSAVMAVLCRNREEVRRVPIEIRREKLLTLRL